MVEPHYAHYINLDLIRSHSVGAYLLSFVSLLLSFPFSLAGALYAAMYAVIRHHLNPTCGSMPEIRITTMSKLIKPLTRPFPRAAGKYSAICAFSFFQVSFLYNTVLCKCAYLQYNSTGILENSL